VVCATFPFSERNNDRLQYLILKLITVICVIQQCTQAAGLKYRQNYSLSPQLVYLFNISGHFPLANNNRKVSHVLHSLPSVCVLLIVSLNFPLVSSNIWKNVSCRCFRLFALITATVPLNNDLFIFDILQIIHFTMWFEFVRFLRNTSRKFCPTDILFIRQTKTQRNTHTKTHTYKHNEHKTKTHKNTNTHK